ncbi:MAG TPA: pyridoxamine 5'-phosphate oxidase family protein [Azospirillaceae bacterium]|nr:pyridoxamine 5'-phosphate oxidase family protein [Azospirillaceae bacterium]
MTDDDLKVHALDLLETAEAAYLTTLDRHGRPQTRAMLNLRRGAQFPALIPFFADRRDGFEMWFTTNTASGKMADLAGNPAVSVYCCRPADWRGLMLGGDMEIIEDAAVKARLWCDGWELYYPKGPSDPDYAVLRLRPTGVRYYHQLRSAVLVG